MEKTVSIFDVSSFVREIEKRPAIWDTSSNEYSVRSKKTKCWLQVCRINTPDFDTLPSERRKEIGAELQRRWKNLRLSFVRRLQKLKGRKPCPDHQSKYPYFDALSFLTPVVSNKETTIKRGKTEEEEQEEVSGGTSGSSGVGASQGKRGKAGGDTVERTCTEDALTGSIHLRADAEQRLQEELTTDGDKHFLLSLLSPMRQVPLYTKMHMRTEIMQVVMKYMEQPTTSSVTLPPPPSHGFDQPDPTVPEIFLGPSSSQTPLPQIVRYFESIVPKGERSVTPDSTSIAARSSPSTASDTSSIMDLAE